VAGQEAFLRATPKGLNAMKNRREFLQMGAAVLVLPAYLEAALSVPRSASPQQPTSSPLYKLIFDSRFPAGVQFASVARELGRPIHGITGDITDLWFSDLYPQWKKNPAPIAGLTTYGSLFCLEHLARDQGLRVVFRAEHIYRHDGCLEHVVSGPEGMLRQAAERAGSANWGANMARVVNRFDGKSVKNLQVSLSTPVARRSGDPEYLVSWVIAPR